VVIYSGLENLGLLVVSAIMDYKKLLASIKPDRRLLASAFFIGASTLLHAKAITMVKVAYFIATKRTSLIFCVLLGWLLLKEKQGGRRFLASIIMVGGIILIVFSK